MRLLFLTPQLPYPPNKGTSIRNYHLIKSLGARHEITLLTFHAGSDEEESGLRPYCHEIVCLHPSRRSTLARLADLPLPGRPDLARRLRSGAFVAALVGLLGRRAFDIVQLEGLEMASFWEMAIARLAHSPRPPAIPRVILDEHNAEYVLQRRAYEIDRRRPLAWHGAFYSFLQWHKLARYERRFCRSIAAVVAASEFDRQALLGLDKRLNIAVVPNGVDVARYRSLPRPEASAPPRLVFAGTMNFRPNVDAVQWFCQRIWPAVLEQAPETSFWIVGRDPKPELRRLADGRRVVVTGDVADVRPYLAAAIATVVPLRFGGGSRLKVLEAMAAGVPVISTTLGCEGIAVTPSSAVIADDPATMARAIVDLLRDEERREQMGAAARALVEHVYDWSVIAPRLEEFHREVVA